MKNTKRQAFTIVELVIVIAVIAILSAVLIPTFGAIIKDANIAADQSAAATLTTELHVYLKGETIDSEEELMAALTDAKISEKLVPKALAYGYHFWFDMATQMIISAHTDDIKPDENESNEEVTASAPAGAQLMSATLTAETTKTYPKSMRHVYGNGYFLVDYNLLNIFCNLDEIDSTNYASYLDEFDASKADYALEDYAEIAGHVLETLKTTVIVNENGTFYHSSNTGNADYYFTDGVEIFSNKINTESGTASTLPAPKDNELEIPDSVLLVQGGAANFGDDNSVVITGFENKDEVAKVFDPNSTNATIKTNDDAEYKVVDDKLNSKEGDDWTKYEADLDVTNASTTFEIGYSKDGIYDDATPGMLYVAAQNGTFKLDAIDPTTDPDIVLENVKWTLDNKHGTFEEGFIDENGNINFTKASANAEYVCQVDVTATTELLYGTSEETLTLVVVMPVSTTIEITHTPTQKVHSSMDNKIGLTFTKDSYKYATTISSDNITYSTDSNGTNTQELLGLTPTITLGQIDESTKHPFTYTENELVYNPSKNENETKDFETAKFKMIVDGYLSINVTAEMVNSGDPIVENDFRHTSSKERPYYVGSGDEIYLSDLFDATELFGNGKITKATVNIYDAASATSLGSLANRNYNNFDVIINDIDPTEDADGKLVYKDTSVVINYDDLKNTKLEFVFANGHSFTFADNTESANLHEIHIEFIPWINGVESKLSYSVSFIVVKDALNITEAEIAAGAMTGTEKDSTTGKIKPGAVALTKDTILHTDLEIKTGTTIDVGTHTLYGNGYVIDASTYVATETKTSATVNVYGTKTICLCGEENPSFRTGCKKLIGGGWNDGHGQKTETYVSDTTTISDVYSMKNYYLIGLNGGTVDNIYLNGPVYSTLQYDSDYTSSSGDEYVNTPYYVSGILASGTSTIINSYVSGFRQPVRTNGTLLTVENTTLRGGNYGNLLHSSGDLKLKNVTTVQDQNGQQATVGDTSKSVSGTGIAIEQTALSNTITIEGYLDQYNWIKQNTNATLPVIPNPLGKDLDMNVLFGAIFTGLPTSMGNLEINRLKRYMWKNQESMDLDDTNNYVNTGIVFCEIGDTAYINGIKNNVKSSIIDETNRTAGNAGTNKFDYLRFVFNEEGIDLYISKIDAVQELETDGIFTIWSYKDGRDWEREGLSFSTNIKAGYEKPHTVLDTTQTNTPSASVAASEFSTGTPAYIYGIYRGYYDNLGAYSDLYNGNANNTIEK